MKDLFGTPIANGAFDSISQALHDAMRFVSPSAARMYALFNYRPFADFLQLWKELREDEIQQELVAFSTRHHACIESLARGKRKAVEDVMRDYKENKRRGTLKSEWLELYEQTQHWESVKQIAKDAFDFDSCQMCSNDATQWHHKTYVNCGTELEYLDIVPVCDDCHLAVHAMHDICKRKDFRCGELTSVVREILEREFGMR